MQRLLVLGAGVLLALSAASTAAAGHSPFGATFFGLQLPEEQCAPDPAEFLTLPTISGKPKVGRVLTTSSGNVHCADFLQATFYRTDSAGNIVATVRTGPVQSCSINECTKTDAYTVTARDAGDYIKAGWRVWNGYTHAYAESPLAGPVPAQPPNALYGDNDEPLLQSWHGGDGGSNAWTVHRYANRYVIWTYGRGTYVIGRSVAGAHLPGNANNYMGPGYIGQFHPREAPPGTLLVNDALFVNGGNPPVVTPRDGIHGGLGCFALDLWRAGTVVDLNCRLTSTGWSPGVYDIPYEAVTPDQLGVTISMTTLYRDGTRPVFSVTYSHRFTAAGVTTTYTWRSETNDEVYIKEPRIVAVVGTVDVPIHDFWGITRTPRPECYPTEDGTYGRGAGAWTLEPDLARSGDENHHFQLKDVVPWCSTITVGPGATSAGRRYHRGGFSFDVVGVPRNLSVDDPGYNHDYDGIPSDPDILNFNGWRRNATGAAVIPGYKDACSWRSDPEGLEPCRMPIGEMSPANAWELARVPNAPRYAPYGQYGVFVAVEAWRASIGPGNFLGRARRLPASGTRYREVLKF